MASGARHRVAVSGYGVEDHHADDGLRLMISRSRLGPLVYRSVRLPAAGRRPDLWSMLGYIRAAWLAWGNRQGRRYSDYCIPFLDTRRQPVA